MRGAIMANFALGFSAQLAFTSYTSPGLARVYSYYPIIVA